MPGNTSAWPDGEVYRYDEIHDSRSLGYAGPAYGWARVPDQYTLAETDRLMTDGPDDRPTMAVVPLVTSHAPWTPVPGLVDPADVGDGSTLTPAGGSAEPPEAILTRDPTQVRADYRQSVVYTLTSVIRQLEQTPAEDLVVIMVGDHQPAPVVTGPDAGRDVPITVLSGDTDVLDRIRDWGWTPGLRPAADAPVWRMDTVRDRILTDFAEELPALSRQRARPYASVRPDPDRRPAGRRPSSAGSRPSRGARRTAGGRAPPARRWRRRRDRPRPRRARRRPPAPRTTRSSRRPP